MLARCAVNTVFFAARSVMYCAVFVHNCLNIVFSQTKEHRVATNDEEPIASCDLPLGKVG